MINKPSEPEETKHVVFNIITDKATRFMSVTATHRNPSLVEVARADWGFKMKRNQLIIHVIGRGDELTQDYCRLIAAAYVDGKPIWKHVDLTRLAAGNTEPPVTELAVDPLWQSILRYAHGGAK